MSQTSYYSDSPPSSPNPCIDSSPPSSPCSEPADLFPIFKEPYAGSHNLTRTPRTYSQEERGKTRSAESLDNPPRKRARVQELPDDIFFETDADMERMPPPQARSDDELWEAATTTVLEEACGRVDLSDKGLKSIPIAAMESLSHFFVPSIMEEREHAPVTPSPTGHRVFSRTSSQVIGIPREKIQLFLRKNDISHIPSELFNLDKLAVLSMAQNNLTSIPPEIQNLRNLEVLNISSNRLTYLPIEIMELTLQSLTATSNPFLSPPADGKPTRHKLFKSDVPSLVEICLRVMVQQDIMSPAAPVTVINALHNCLCVPHSLPPKRDTGYDSVTGVGRCPCGQDFVLHMEEMFIWESRIAGTDLGMKVPLRRRGCTGRCLKDESRGEEDAAAEDGELVGPPSPVRLAGLEEDFWDGE